MKQLKNRIRMILMIAVVTITSVIQTVPISAQGITITTEHSDIISTGYFEAVNSRGWAVQRKSGHNSNIIYVNRNVAFCVEPEISRGDGVGYTVSDFSHEQREIFSQIIYHGYDNTGKTGKDYVVTQNVLWEYIESIRDDLSINGSWGFEGIDYQYEKEQIWAKVNTHDTKASFQNSTVNLKTKWTNYYEKKYVYRCASRMKHGTRFCGCSPTLDEQAVKSAVMQVISDVKGDDNLRDTLIENINSVINPFNDIEGNERMTKIKKNIDQYGLNLLEFDEALVNGLIDRIIVKENKLIVIHFKAGMSREIKTL